MIPDESEGERAPGSHWRGVHYAISKSGCASDYWQTAPGKKKLMVLMGLRPITSTPPTVLAVCGSVQSNPPRSVDVSTCMCSSHEEGHYTCFSTRRVESSLADRSHGADGRRLCGTDQFTWPPPAAAVPRCWVLPPQNTPNKIPAAGIP